MARRPAGATMCVAHDHAPLPSHGCRIQVFPQCGRRFLVRPSGARWEIGSADHVTGQLLCQMGIAGMRFDTAELAIAMLGRSMAELSRANAA